jgi:hypothetical protein
MTTYTVFLGCLDLFLCLLVFKLVLSKRAIQRLVVDRRTGEVYYINESIPHADTQPHPARLTVLIGEIDEDETFELEEEKERVRLAFNDTYEELGWESCIIS